MERKKERKTTIRKSKPDCNWVLVESGHGLFNLKAFSMTVTTFRGFQSCRLQLLTGNCSAVTRVINNQLTRWHGRSCLGTAPCVHGPYQVPKLYHACFLFYFILSFILYSITKHLKLFFFFNVILKYKAKCKIGHCG
jgi:hypothetical protein